MVMFNIMGKTPQNPFCLNKAFEIFLLEIFSIKSRKIPESHTWYMWWSWKVSSQSQLICFIKIFQNHSCPEPNLNNSTLPTVSYWSQTLWTCSNLPIMHPPQVVHQGKQIHLSKPLQTPLCWFLELEIFALSSFSVWSQTFWACSNTQIMPPHKVVH